MIPKVSILIPVYNTSQFIEKCVHSLFQQTFPDIEFIFVNDASTDNSVEILQNIILQYPERKNYVKIVHHDTNLGLANVRNTALNNSMGNYISVVDSDDYIEPEMIEVLYKKAIEMDADIVISDMFMEYSTGTIYSSDFLSENINDHFPDIIKNEASHSFLCNKLLRRSLYSREDCRVPSGLNYYEDRHVMTRLFFFAKKIVKVNNAYYHYIHYNPNAITKKKSRMHFQNVVLFWELLEDFLKTNRIFDKYTYILEYPKVQSKVRLMLDANSSSLRKEYADIYLNEELKFIHKFRFGERVMMFLIRKHQFVMASLIHKVLLFKNRFCF